jgi:hypothetical protein
MLETIRLTNLLLPNADRDVIWHKSAQSHITKDRKAIQIVGAATPVIVLRLWRPLEFVILMPLVAYH